MPRSPQDLSDEELDTYVLARLELLGVDLSVLPADDPEAPADRRRILSSARRFLRATPGAIAGFEMDVQNVVPSMYPAVWSAARDGRPGGGA
jgi:hypothetical protein